MIYSHSENDSLHDCGEWSLRLIVVGYQRTPILLLRFQNAGPDCSEFGVIPKHLKVCVMADLKKLLIKESGQLISPSLCFHISKQTTSFFLCRSWFIFHSLILWL